jgi:NifU-like protein involved in Fe-S cluster formation
MVLHLRLSGSRIQDCRFKTFGCGHSIACGSVLTELIRGRALAECDEIQESDILDRLPGVPEEKRWCAGFVIGCLRDAMAKAPVSTCG